MNEKQQPVVEQIREWLDQATEIDTDGSEYVVVSAVALRRWIEEIEQEKQRERTEAYALGCRDEASL